MCPNTLSLNQLKEEQNFHYALSCHGTLSTMVRAAVFETVDIGSIPVECYHIAQTGLII
jgi:hypothetical protein